MTNPLNFKGGNMKKYEMVYEANNFDGHQIFACEADNEEEAKEKFKAGECDIVEQSIEVLSLGELHDIYEVDDIENRLPCHLLAVACDELEESKKIVTEMYEMLQDIHLTLGDEYSDELDKIEKLLAKVRGGDKLQD